jgi:hypothetical protein
VELFARFLLDCGGIGLELLDTVGVLRILFLEAIDFSLKRLHLGALLPVDDNSIRAEHRVQHGSTDQQDGQGDSKPAPLVRQPRPSGARALNPARSRRFGARPLLHDRAESILGTRQDSWARWWPQFKVAQSPIS